MFGNVFGSVSESTAESISECMSECIVQYSNIYGHIYEMYFVNRVSLFFETSSHFCVSYSRKFVFGERWYTLKQNFGIVCYFDLDRNPYFEPREGSAARRSSASIDKSHPPSKQPAAL